MLADPGYWASYYEGDEEEQRIARRYSYSDRIRYYWAAPEVEARVRRLFENLGTRGIPNRSSASSCRSSSPACGRAC